MTNVVHMITTPPRPPTPPVTARCENPEDTQRLPHAVEIYPHLVDLDADVDGEAEDVLKAEVVAWIKANISRGGSWGFFTTFEEDAQSEDPSPALAFIGVTSSFHVRFRRSQDAFHFKMRWHGPNARLNEE